MCLNLASSASSTVVTDPLSASNPLSDPLSSQDLDPLSRMVAEDDTFTRAVHAATTSTGVNHVRTSLIFLTPQLSKEKLDDSFEPWALKRAGILAKYTTNEKLSISFSGSKGTAVVKSATTDKVSP